MRSPIPQSAWLLSLVLAGCVRDDGGQQVLGTVERDRLELVAETNERIIEMAVQEGDHVAEGAPLLRQEAGTMQPRLDQARASVAEAERSRAWTRTGRCSVFPALT